jgi:hypothetical protein
MNQFLGMPSDGGMHSVSNSRSPNGNSEISARAGAAAGNAAGSRNTQASGAQGAAAGAAVANRNAPNASGAQGAAAGAAVANRNSPQFSGAQGAAAGAAVANRNSPEFSGAQGAAAGFGYMSSSNRYGQAYGVRTGFTGYGLYTPAWYGAHPGVWAGAGATTAAWTAASWNAISGWFGTSAPPVDYNYGTNVVTQGDNVYVDGQDGGTTDQYYQQTADLANAGAQAPAAADPNWLPLGVFAMTQADRSNSNMIIQLAVDKQGIIRGNFTDTKTNKTQSVQGSIDKKTQRAAWTIGDKKDDVLETGLYNLTKDEVPALLHYGKDRTEQWLLVRVKQDDQQQTQN